MTAAELCFIAATIVLVMEALPGVKIVSRVSVLPLGLALVALGLALQAGLAQDLSIGGEILSGGL